MEVSEFERNYDLGETIFVKDFFCSLPSFDYPIKVGMTSDKDIDIMIEAEKGQKTLIRGYTIEEQLRMREHCEINGDGVINIGLSQETENMFQNDYSFIQKLQEDQKNACLDVRESNEAIVEEQVVIVREAVNAIDNDKVLLN